MNSLCINIQTIFELCSGQSFRGTYIIGMHVTRATEFRLGSPIFMRKPLFNMYNNNI